MTVEEPLQLSSHDIQYVVENIFLPPKLPQSGDDAYIVSHETSMLAVVADALQKFTTTIHGNDKIAIDGAVKAMQRFRQIIDGSGFLNEDMLREAFYDLSKNGGFLLLHVRAQNAGMVMTCDKDAVVFEPFELSPQNASVMANSGRLKRSFPASSTAVSLEVFQQNQCQAGLANTIATMSHQEVPEMKPKITKAGDQHIEERDTTAPTIVTDFLVAGLSAIGRPSQGSKIWKNTREEVLWSGADSPWRRSPVWLLVRVAIQLHISRSASKEGLYKEFMVFFMAYILQCCEDHDIPSDLLHCMMAKISKRLNKIDRNQAYPWIATIGRILRNCQSRNEERWNILMRKDEAPVNIHSLSAKEISQGKFVTCEKLDEFLEQIYSRQVIKADNDFTPPWILAKNDKDDLPSLEAISAKDQSTICFYLSAFETWIETCLNAWLASNISRQDTCERLYNITKAYHNLALSQYHEDPDNLSIMFLVIMELWVSCDKAATQHHPLILNYRSEMPHELLQSLILPLRGQMERLKTVEDYLEQRRARAYFSYPSIFHSFGHAHSFSVQYFESSLAHQTLLRDIEQKAEAARQRKKDEFSRLKDEYDSWLKLYNSTSHDFEDVVDWKTGISTSEHSSSCTKCHYLNRADTLRIKIHEWPLPQKEYDAKSTVFELKVPKCFNDWRNMSSFCRIDVLRSLYGGSGNGSAEWTLGGYLPSYYADIARVIILASTTKPNAHTHRSFKLVKTAVLEDVLVANGMRYGYYDVEQRRYISETHCTDDVPKMCTYTLSPQCASLQDFIFRPHYKPNGLTPNHVISRQAMCPDHLSLEEFKAMASNPVGYRLGWKNILVNLHTPALDFRKLDTVLILLQMSRQTGPPLLKSALRETHKDLDSEMFAIAFLQGLRLALARISENWESFHALFAFTSLATRILSWAPSPAISRDYISFIGDCREVSLAWLRNLQDRVNEAQEETQRTELIERVFQVALVCMSSFYVDEKHLGQMVKNSEEACIMIESSIAIQSTMQFAMKPEDAFHRGATNRWQQCLYQAHQLYIEEILCGRSSWLDNAITNTWSTYPGGGEWTTLSAAADNWLVTRTVAGNGFGSLNVYFNLLTAELLVNGLPLSRLPAEYERHQSYETYFGRSMVEVMPTDMPGMQFSSKGAYHGYKIYFGLSAPEYQDLLLVAIKAGEMEREETFDLIPPRVFDQILPRHFVDEYSHWYCRGTGEIQFRPKFSPWDLPSEYWKMLKPELSLNSGWVMEKSGQFLFGLTAIAVKRLHELLAPLENSDYIHVIADSDSNRVKIELPRFQLEFWSNQESDKIYSRQFRDMHIDPCQNIGVLTGLESKLVLTDGLQRRKLLLPSGKAKWHGSEDHNRVVIPYGTSERVHFYDVDTLLGRLVDNGSLQSKLILCYLHALTSNCLPDPLTGMTGTEAALTILDSAAVRSFQCLSEQNLERLYCIAKLSPSRHYYPDHLRGMESTLWIPGFSSLSQNVGFHRSVQSILRQAASFKFFYPGTYVEPQVLDWVDPLLEERQAIRLSSFHLFGYGAEDYTRSKDVFYHGRDRPLCSDRCHRSFKIAKSLFTKQATLFEAIPFNFADTLWAYLSQNASMLGPDSPLPDSFVSYDAKWLEDARPLLSSHWCQLYRALGRDQNNMNTIQAMFCLAAMGYSKSCNLQVIQILVACVTIPSVGGIIIPTSRSYQLSDGHKAALDWIRDVAGRNSKPFSDTPDSHISPYHRESASSLTNRRYQNFHQNLDTAVLKFSEFLQSQWICKNPQAPYSHNIPTYIHLERAMEVVQQRWVSWLSNSGLYDHFVEVVSVLGRYSIGSFHCDPPIETPSIPTQSAKRAFFNDCDLFKIFNPGLPQLVIPDTNPELLGHTADHPRNYSNGAALVERLRLDTARHNHQSNYVSDLEKSFEKLSLQDHQYFIKSYGGDLVDELERNLQHCQEDAGRIYDVLATNMRPSTVNAPNTETTLAISLFMAPRISPAFFLRQLASTWWNDIPDQWKKAIVDYGLALSRLQRAKRMRYLYDNREDLMKELLNVGHRNWQPLDYPKSLLLEIESDILIRENQESVAANMRTPPNGKNVTMQLNMGEGKSSIIVPMIAAYLADGSRLVRVIVTKPQAKELHRILITKLGGWLGNRVYYMPFSRSLRLTANDCISLDSIYRDCMKSGGVLLAQPEHILSQKLMGIECLLSGREEVGRVLLDTQQFLDLNTRDIVDESDENFSVKFELIYTMGTQRPIELSPERWILIQNVLTLMARIVPQVEKSLPDSIEVNRHAEGCFPKTRILRQDALDSLLHQLCHEICNEGLLGFPVVHQEQSVRDAVLSYISTALLSSEQIASVEKCSSFYSELTKGPLLLLRGLIAEGILGFIFEQKRWRVNYGLAPTRQPATRLAVPYRAKDNPAPRSEFSHIDVVIVLTCLSYYYGGLSDNDLFLCFEHLMKLDQAETEYSDWIQSVPSLPESFRRLVGVNIKDHYQVTHNLFPHLRYSKNVVDHFLAHIVFPKEMKEFPEKLSASGWDIGQQKIHPTTGFSGTNDSRNLLPLEIKQLDLDDQLHTNALVLERLLQPENSVALMSRLEGEASSGSAFLTFVGCLDSPAHVILDVGAQIIELTNIQVAQEWLKRVPVEKEKEAVVFFDDTDELCAIDRKGYVEKLQTSPYSHRLDLCLVYLDEAHTRGTDLKLPTGYRAAVTLGPNLTKDRLVQACMRMRKLGQGQSVVFCVPEEIQTKICSATGLSDGNKITVMEVLHWAILETYADTRRNMPLWAVQGERFERQKAIWGELTDEKSRQLSLEEAKMLLEAEAQSMEDRYGPCLAAHTKPKLPSSSENRAILEIQERCKQFDCLGSQQSTLLEEQERELSPEMEQERQVQRPHPADPRKHSLHPDVVEFIKSGRIPPSSTAFIPAFQTLWNTSAANNFDVEEFPESIVTTLDYRDTVALSGNDSLQDSYQRPVQWILSTTEKSSTVQRLVIISPHEAQELMPSIESSSHVTLHLYAPRPNLTFAPLDSLQLYPTPFLGEDWQLPSSMRLLLNIFSGQLYFASHTDYEETCRMLSLAWQGTENGVIVEADGFIPYKACDKERIFTKSPVKFLKVLLTKIRRDCEGIDKTHWGMFFAGGTLHRDDFSEEATG